MYSCQRIGRHAMTAAQRLSSRNDDTGSDPNSSSLASADRQFNSEGPITRTKLGKNLLEAEAQLGPHTAPLLGTDAWCF